MLQTSTDPLSVADFPLLGALPRVLKAMSSTGKCILGPHEHNDHQRSTRQFFMGTKEAECMDALRARHPGFTRQTGCPGKQRAGSADSSHKIQGLQRQTGRKLKKPRSCSKWSRAALKDKATTEPFRTSGFRKVMLPF